MEMIKRFFKDESGATMVEYAILVALIAVAVVVTVLLVRDALNDTFTSISECLGDSAACPGAGG